MDQSGGTSLFTRQIDRAALTNYFLGAIVPLVALAVVVDVYALPEIEDGKLATALIGAVVSIGVLSLGAFLTLRQVTRRTIRRIDRDNLRLSALLSVARTLASTEHVSETTRTSALSALDLAEADGAYLYVREESKPSLAESAGDEAELLYAQIQPSLDEIAVLAMEENRSVLRGVSPGDARPFAAAAVPLPGEKEALGALVAVRTGSDSHFGHDIENALSTLGALAAVSLHNADLRDAQRNFFSHVTDMLVTALDNHLGFNVGHGNRVAALANRVGRTLEFDEQRLQRLHFASLLHDIGMLKLDRNNQMNPRACEKHCTLGFRMLHRIRVWKDVAPSVQSHHEWWDGSGYPQGLAGDAIPLEARIIGLVDAFDTMTSDASYKPAIGIDEALEELERCSGRQFDPEVVDAFLKLAKDGALD
jgi:putative nucleotidyltransferase with HDIG domain